MAVMAGMCAFYLAKRKEEAAKTKALEVQASAKTASLRAGESAKAQNDPQGKPMLENALKYPALAPETADLTEEERLARYKQSERYQAYQSRMMEWHAEQERKRKEIEFLATADLTEAERLARYKQTAEYQTRQARLQAWEREQAYQSYRQGERAEPQKKSFWQKAGEWLQQKVVRPVQQVTGSIVNALKPPQTAGSYKSAESVKDDDPPWWEKAWETAKSFVQEKIVMPVQASWNDAKTKVGAFIRDTAIRVIPPAAEFVYKNAYLPTVSFAGKHPYLTKKTTWVVDSILDYIVRPVLNRVVDTNPDTMGWIDLGMTWLFELGDKSELVFGPRSNLTQDIMKHDVVQEVRTAAIEKIIEGRLEDVLADCISPENPVSPGQYPVCKPSQFGVSKYFQSLDDALRGDLSKEYLGSYTVTIYVEPQGDGLYVFHYQVKNPSTWESATRFRVDSPTDNDTVNEGFIPDTSPRGKGITLGGRLDQTFEWTETIYIPEGGGEK